MGQFRFDSTTTNAVQDPKFLPQFNADFGAYVRNLDGLNFNGLDHEDSLVLAKHLTYVEQERRRLYRPTKFRSLFNVTSNVPEAIEYIELSEVQEFAKLVQIANGAVDLPMPTLTRNPNTVKALSLGCAYSLTDDEIMQAAYTGRNVSMAKIAANDTASEQFLEAMAATGFAPTGLLGFANQTSVSTIAPATKGVGGTSWSTAGVTAIEIINDLEAMYFGVLTGSKENFSCTELLVPIEAYKAASTVMIPNTQVSALAQFIANHNNSVKVATWNPLKTAGAGSTTRAIAGELTRPEVARFELPTGLISKQPERRNMTTIVPQKIRIVGPIVETPSGMLYMDGI